MSPRKISRRRFLLPGGERKSERCGQPRSSALATIPPDVLSAGRRRALVPLPPLPALSNDDQAGTRSSDAHAVPHQVVMGVAVIAAARCTAWRGLPCRICREVCPVDDAIVLERREHALVPVAGPSACTGCGACVEHCPAEGAIRIFPASDDGDARVRVIRTAIDAG